MLKKFAANTAGLFSSPLDGSTGRSSTADKFSNARRRIVHSWAGAKGRSPDDEYDARKAGLAQYERDLRSLEKGVSTFLDGARSFAFTAGEVGRAAGCVLEGADPRHGDAIAAFSGQLGELESRTRADLDRCLLSDVIEPLRGELAVIERAHARMRERENVKIDYDARLLKVNTWKEKGTQGQPEKLVRKEEKLARTLAALQEATGEVYGLLDELETRRWSVLPGLLNTFAGATRDFLAVCTSTVQPLPMLPAMSAPPAALRGAGSMYTASGSSAGSGGGTGGGGLATVPIATAAGRAPSSGSLGKQPGAAVGAKTVVSSTATATAVGAPMGGVGSGQPPSIYGAGAPSGVGSAYGGGAVAGAGGSSRFVESDPADSFAKGGGANPFGAGSEAVGRQPGPGMQPGGGRAGSYGGSGAPFGGGGVTSPTLPARGASAGGAPGGGEGLARVSFAYQAANKDELSVAPGDMLQIIRRHSDGWVEARRTRDGATGMVPENHTKAM